MGYIKSQGNHRDANEPPIITALQGAGCHVERIAVGADLLVGYDGQTFLLEVKRPRRPCEFADVARMLTPAQVKFRAAWNGGPYAIVINPAEALKAVGL